MEGRRQRKREFYKGFGATLTFADDCQTNKGVSGERIAQEEAVLGLREEKKLQKSSERGGREGTDYWTREKRPSQQIEN